MQKMKFITSSALILNPVILNFSGYSAAISSVCFPIEPVEPTIEIFFKVLKSYHILK